MACHLSYKSLIYVTLLCSNLFGNLTALNKLYLHLEQPDWNEFLIHLGLQVSHLIFFLKSVYLIDLFLVDLVYKSSAIYLDMFIFLKKKQAKSNTKQSSV